MKKYDFYIVDLLVLWKARYLDFLWILLLLANSQFPFKIVTVQVRKVIGDRMNMVLELVGDVCFESFFDHNFS